MGGRGLSYISTIYCMLSTVYSSSIDYRLLLASASQTPRPQLEIRPVAVETSGQKKRRAAQQRGESETFADGVFATCQAFGTLVVGVAEESTLLLDRHQRRQLDSQEP